METTDRIDNWLKLDLREFKNRLLQLAQEWKELYTNHLINDTNNK